MVPHPRHVCHRQPAERDNPFPECATVFLSERCTRSSCCRRVMAFPARHCELNGHVARQLSATLRSRHRGAAVERAHQVLRPIFAGLIGPGVLLNRALRGCSNRGPTKPPTIRPLVAISASPSLSPSQWPRRTQTNLPPANPVRFKRPCAADLHHRILVRLDAIDKAASLAALGQPGFDFHPLRGPVPRRTRSTSTARGASPSSGVRGALRVDLEQYH